ncbi:uncharacterized protein [Palaemon carinicauda]|uniref:uncharacterized protein n=1 Tax=Palaemon carinicauda TaxID=392227 RepID=UPI0035B6A7B9
MNKASLRLKLLHLRYRKLTRIGVCCKTCSSSSHPAFNKKGVRQDPDRRDTLQLDAKRRKATSLVALDDGQLPKRHAVKHGAERHDKVSVKHRDPDPIDTKRQTPRCDAERQPTKCDDDRHAAKRDAERQVRRDVERQVKRDAQRQSDVERHAVGREAERKSSERHDDVSHAERQYRRRRSADPHDREQLLSERRALDHSDTARDDPTPVLDSGRARKESPLVLQDASTTVRVLSEEESDDHFSPAELLDDFSEGEEPKSLHHSVDLKKIMKLFTEQFPDQFVPVAPRSPPSEFTLGKAAKESLFTKMLLSRSSKSLVDSPCRLAMRRTKILRSTSEFDHLLKGVFRAFEVFNFLDWTLGALGKKVSTLKDPDTQFYTYYVVYG